MATNSPNKGYLLPATGEFVDTWGEQLNNLVFTIIDNNLGGITSKSLTNLPVILNVAESQNLRLILNGTLTGDVLVSTQAIGLTIVENRCTGPFVVTFQKQGVGTPIVIPNGTNNVVVTGAADNPVVAGIDFPAGTRIPFQQTTPPPGYTKDTATAGLNNSALRLVTGTVANGGVVDFTTAFAVQSSGGAVQQMTLDISQIPAHTHTYDQPVMASSPTGSGASRIEQANPGVATGSAGGGLPHNHGFTPGSIDLRVRYFDFVIGVRQ